MNPPTLKELKEEIITKCHAWSVDYMLKKMDKLILLARKAGKKEGEKDKMKKAIKAVKWLTNKCIELSLDNKK